MASDSKVKIFNRCRLDANQSAENTCHDKVFPFTIVAKIVFHEKSLRNITWSD